MSSKKTIKINPDFFRTGKKTKKKRERKEKPIFTPSLRPNNIKKQLLQRIKHYIPHIYRGKQFHSINERLRFLKYETDDNFNRHMDACYSDESNNISSMITILIYLNENYEGANTTFFTNSNDNKGFSLVPKIGMVCLMDQDIQHEVPQLLNGIKYALRTELMYEN